MTRRNPPIIPGDTSRDVWERQMAAIARRDVDDRLAEWAEFNLAMSRMEADGVRRRHPGYTEDEVIRALARHRYGDDLAQAAWPDAELLDP